MNSGVLALGALSFPIDPHLSGYHGPAQWDGTPYLADHEIQIFLVGTQMESPMGSS